ncbi:hypothetical protein [Gloeomargarita lithophora]|nr:hypothetical protein [Gloeomargarita lithophora]
MKPYAVPLALAWVSLGFAHAPVFAKPPQKPPEVIEPSGLEPIIGPSPELRREIESLNVPAQPTAIPPLEIQGTPPNTQEFEFRITPVEGPGRGSGPDPN